MRKESGGSCTMQIGVRFSITPTTPNSSRADRQAKHLVIGYPRRLTPVLTQLTVIDAALFALRSPLSKGVGGRR